MARKLSVIIPAFRGLEQVRHCLDSLGKSEFRDFDTVLVDHGESDIISQQINKEFPETLCIRGSPDHWWAGSTNLGIKHALNEGNPWIMLLNHDCYIQKETIGTLMEAAGSNADRIIAPQQHNTCNKRDIIGATSCLLLGFPTIIPPAGWYRMRYPTGLVPTQLIIGGRGVIISASTFNRVGLMDDESLPHYCADHDFYFRCRKAGVRLFICTDTQVNIDSEMTSSADASPRNFSDFISDLKDRGSHRNIRDLRVFFSRYYPIPGLSVLGVTLNTGRFFIKFLLGKIAGFFGHTTKERKH